MGCAPGHRSSPFCRFGTIHGVPNASHDLSFDLSYQPFHQRPVRLSPVSSRDLAKIWASCMPTKVRRTAPRRTTRLMKRVPAACSPGVLRPALWSHRKRSESTPWSVPTVNSHFDRSPKPRSRAIELEGGGGARRGAISAHKRPRVPRPSAGPAGSLIRAMRCELRVPPNYPPDPGFRPRPGDFTVSSLRTQLIKN